MNHTWMFFWAVMSFTCVALGSSFPRVDADLKAYDDEVARMDAQFRLIPPEPGNAVWVGQELQYMVDVDQYTIAYHGVMFDHAYSAEERRYFEPIIVGHYLSVIKVHAAAVNDLLKLYEWITIGRFGAQADDNAWLLVQHDDQDLAFQKKILPVLERLYPRGETRPSNYAYLFDRVAVHDAPPRPQRYGSQGHCSGPGTWEPDPIEDEPNVDKRRAALGMVTMAEYKTWFTKLCRTQ